MAFKSGNEEEGISDINVTPLVDIMLVLVIILMVTAEFTKYKTINIALPKLNAVAIEKEPYKVTLTIKQDGSIYWYDKVIPIELLEKKLKATKQKHPKLAVILRAESKTQYDRLAYVIDTVKLSGISKIGLAAESSRKKKK